MQHCRLFLGKVGGFAFFFEYLCIVAFFFCLAKLQNRLLCGESVSDEECNIAGCPWGRMQGLHSSLSTFALLHSSFVLQNYRIGCHVAKVFQMKSATLQVVSEEGCRVCILLLSVFALLHSSFSDRCYLHCCILLFLPDATPYGSFFNRVSHAKPAEKEKPAREN